MKKINSIYYALFIILCMSSSKLFSMGAGNPVPQITEDMKIASKKGFRQLLPQFEELEKAYAVNKESGEKKLNEIGQKMADNAKDIVPDMTYSIKDSQDNEISRWKIINKKTKNCTDYSNPAHHIETYVVKLTAQEIPSFYKVRPTQYEFSAKRVTIGGNQAQFVFSFNISYPILWKKAGLFGIGAGLGAAALYYGWYPQRPELKETVKEVAQKIIEQVPQETISAIQESVTQPPPGFTAFSPYE